MFKIGSVTLAFEEEPYEGNLTRKGSGASIVVQKNAYGLKGRIKQYIGKDSGEHNIKCLLSEDTVTALQTIVDAFVPVVIQHDKDTVGTLYTITQFLPVWTSNVKGDITQGWDTSIVLVEE